MLLSLEIFDSTTPRKESDAQQCWHARMVRPEGDELFYNNEERYDRYDLEEPAVHVSEGVAIMAMDLQDEEEVMVNMVRIQEVGYEGECISTLSRCLCSSYIEHQGRKTAHDGIARATVRVGDKRGKEIEFVLGNARPILCAGKLLKKGLETLMDAYI